VLTVAIDYISNFIAITLQLGICVYAWRTGVFKSNPVFVVYSFLVPITNLIDFIFQVTLQYPLHYYFYWVCEFIHILLGFIVIHEVLTSIFEEYEGIRTLGMYLFNFSAMLLILLGVFASATTKTHGFRALYVVTMQIDTAVRYVQCGLVLFLIFFMRTLSLKWQRRSFGIAFGFGCYSAMFLIYSFLLLRAGPEWNKYLDPVLPVGYVFIVMIWVIAVMVPERVLVTQELPDLRNIEQWNAAILEFLHR
jgi:hypothetical protein